MSRSARFWLAMLLAFLSSRAGGQNPPELPKQLTLSQALSIALNNSSVIRKSQNRLEQATGRTAQSKSELLPQIYASARQAYLSINLRGLGLDIPGATTGKIGPFSSMDARVTLTQDLLNIANLESWKSFRSRQESTTLLVNNARETVVLDVVATYLQALRAKESRDTVIEQTKLATDLYNLTQDRVKQGVSAPLEANRALQQVNSLQQQQQEAEQSYISAKLALANILQARITSEYEVDDEAAYGREAPIDSGAAIQAAMATRPDYRSALATVRAAQLQVQSVKAYRYPTISASFSDGQSGETPVHNLNTYRLQGAIEFPIFTSGRIRGAIDEAQGALREAQTGLDQLRSQIETEVLTAIAGVEWAKKEVATSAANVKLSREEVELSTQRFTRGVADNTEVVNAQDRVSRADDARVRALYTLGLARANLARAIGAAEKTYRK
ncbi:MAG TPA: TolC family protein [Candidatus Acidoferrales bacterium]|nr:TolC family protein [Candidatus Acidoferrales bacterium]